ncbi:MAG TPA: ABC transporter ATP-binding protein [Firmicutes bacterium]|nr:ABC transporter ATP-binding protein [Bacillota bacterium]
MKQAVSVLLKVEDLRVDFQTEDGVVRAVDGVDLEVERGETLAIVGESGCGKSVTSLAIMGLIDHPGRIASGRIIFGGEDLRKKSPAEMRHIRGNRISMIFQEPMTSLNPVFTIGQQIVEAIQLHQHVDVKEARERAIDMLKLVGIPEAAKRVDEYPHQLSGGMRQRAMIAMALSCRPELLIADEPTTALDVTIQAQILDLMRKLRNELGTSIILITHDMGVVAEMADRVAVMYTGRIVEEADVRTLFAEARHPYTAGLLASIPKLHAKTDRLKVIEGTVPNPFELPPGCTFAPRCPAASARCQEAPALGPAGPGHLVACWNADGISA